jgi:hypothetical protein
LTDDGFVKKHKKTVKNKHKKRKKRQKNAVFFAFFNTLLKGRKKTRVREQTMLHLRCIRRAGAAPRPCGLHFVSAVRLCAFCALTAKAASGKKRLRRAYVKRPCSPLCCRISFRGQIFKVKSAEQSV